MQFQLEKLRNKIAREDLSLKHTSDLLNRLLGESKKHSLNFNLTPLLVNEVKWSQEACCTLGKIRSDC